MDDDEEPPPLASLSEQVAAVDARRSGGDGQQPGVVSDPATATAAPRSAAAAGRAPAGAGGMRKGFFDAPRKEATQRPVVIDVKHKAAPAGAPKPIPDFLRLPPEERPAQLRQHLIDVMAPTPDMIGSIQGNSELSALFEDAEVMAAVGEVARDSSAIAKHQRNPKVMRFYSLMGSLMGDRLTQLGDQQQAQPQAQPPPSAPPPAAKQAPKQPQPAGGGGSSGDVRLPRGFLLGDGNQKEGDAPLLRKAAERRVAPPGGSLT